MPEHELLHHEAEDLHFATCTCGWRSALRTTQAEVQGDFLRHLEDA